MNIWTLIAFLCMAVGLFVIFRIDIKGFLEDLSKPLARKKPTMRRLIKQATSKKKLKGIRLIVAETRDVLELTGRSEKFSYLTIISLVCMVIGVMVALSLNNYIMLPIMAVGFSLIPFWYILFTANSFRKNLNNELETALSVITTSYLRSEDIITAIEENVHYLHPPMVQLFEGFLAKSKLINSNIKSALLSMQGKLHNEVFDEWIDAIIACQEDKTLKATLIPIVSKLSDMRIVTSELEYLIYEPMKEFITMALLLIGNIPLLYFLNRDWYNTLMETMVGKVILAVCAVVLFVGTAAVIRLSRPIEYKR